jgi:two-component system sensor histidine kinase UhpB
MMLVVTFMLVGVILLATIIGTAVVQQSRLLRLRQSLSGRLIEAQDRERAALARELHDDVVGRLDAVSRGLRALSNGDANDYGAELAELADELRDVSRQLHPSLVDLRGLAVALQALGEEIGLRAGIEVAVHVGNESHLLPKPAQLALFRIAQEALRNAIKHSRAGKVEIRLTCTSDLAELVITDGGVGFVAEDARKAAGLGLLSMAERARFLGGRFQIDSTPGAGTRVGVLIPTTGKP